MREFFKGWRRKVGCVTLVIACAFTGAWLRSMFICDLVDFAIENHQHEFFSVHGHLLWRARFKLHTSNSWQADSLGSNKIRELWRKFETGDRWDDTWVLPYFPFAVAFTLLSAYLLLWIPRKRTGADHA